MILVKKGLSRPTGVTERDDMRRETVQIRGGHKTNKKSMLDRVVGCKKYLLL